MKRDRERNGITAGLLLIGLGVLMYTGWWWPGMMIVLGLSIGAGLVFRGKYVAAAIILVIFIGIPAAAETNTIPWNLFTPMVLIGLGVIILSKAFFLKDEQKDDVGQVSPPTDQKTA